MRRPTAVGPRLSAGFSAVLGDRKLPRRLETFLSGCPARASGRPHASRERLCVRDADGRGSIRIRAATQVVCRSPLNRVRRIVSCTRI